MAIIVLHVDRLVLKGLARTDAAAITDGLRDALQARFSEPDARATLTAQSPRGVLNAGKVRLGPGNNSASIGAALAKGITGGGRQ